VTLTEALLHRHYRFDSADPAWPDRDRLVLPSHRPDVPQSAATVVDGPPGLAFGAALGLAMAERLLAARFGRSLVDHRTWLLAGARDLVAGTAQEAALVAGALPLGRLAVLAILPETGAPALRRRMLAGFTAAGWIVRTIAQGDEAAADAALSACLRSQKPTLIAEFGQDAGHVPPDTPHPPEDDEQSLRAAAKRGPGARRSWLKRLRRHPAREAFQHAQTGTMPLVWQKHMQMEEGPAASPQPMAASIQSAIGRVFPVLPELTGVPLRDVPGLPASSASVFPTRHLAWDGLDQATAAGALGMALHGGLLPVLWAQLHQPTTLPALRAAAHHRVRLLHILPDEPAAPLTPIHGVMSFSPAEGGEALDCLALALRRSDGPSVLALSDTARPSLGQPRHCGRGAYIVGGPGRCDVTLLATGAAVATALAAQTLLASRQVAAVVASMPCRALFDVQDVTYRRGVLGTGPVIALGTGDRTPFSGLIGTRDLMLTQAASEPLAIVVDAILRHLQRSAPPPETS
jgi:transketolase